jgi:GNAT superfamily N-acetyltransferase
MRREISGYHLRFKTKKLFPKRVNFEVYHNGVRVGYIEVIENKESYHIQWSTVDERYRGKKIGYALYEYAIHETYKHGKKSLTSDEEVSREAQRVYGRLKRLGYEVTGGEMQILCYVNPYVVTSKLVDAYKSPIEKLRVYLNHEVRRHSTIY